jgi:hypothetical protein
MPSPPVFAAMRQCDKTETNEHTLKRHADDRSDCLPVVKFCLRKEEKGKKKKSRKKQEKTKKKKKAG